jgi:hypothetical protein
MIQKITAAVFIAASCFGGVIIVLGLLGAMVEGIADWKTEHDRCLKHAVNGYEIGRCR